MPADPAADLGGIAPAAIVEPAVLVAARRRVGFGLGVTQQHQTAHGAISIRLEPGLMYKPELKDKVTSTGSVRKKTI